MAEEDFQGIAVSYLTLRDHGIGPVPGGVYETHLFGPFRKLGIVDEFLKLIRSCRGNFAGSSRATGNVQGKEEFSGHTLTVLVPMMHTERRLKSALLVVSFKGRMNCLRSRWISSNRSSFCTLLSWWAIHLVFL
jgi:hypothetical protein